jgi:predicted nucleic acid-binding protein
MVNFHLPLPPTTYADLRAEAERCQVAATTVAREAIAIGLEAKKKSAKRRAIQEYAEAMAGTQFDLDPALEAAGIEEILRAGGKSSRNSKR